VTARLPSGVAGVVDDLFEAFLEGADGAPAPGVAYGVVVDGELVHAGGLGTAVVGEERTPGPDTVFRIASMTKSFVAAAVLVLRDRGLLSLDDPVQQHAPEAAGIDAGGGAPAITIRQLLCMSAGLPQDDPLADRLESVSEAELTGILAAPKTFVWAPGLAFDYSNLGFATLGRVVANVGGASFQDVIDRELIRPLGLLATRWSAREVVPGTLAPGYRSLDGAWELQPMQETGAFSAIGGLFSSVRDIATWIGGYCDSWAPGGGIGSHPLDRASRREQQRVATAVPPQLARDHRGRLRVVAGGYCLGLVSEEDLGIGRVVSHSGGYPGYGTHMRWHPATRIGIVALANGRYAPVWDPAAAALGQVVEALSGRRCPPPAATAFAAAQDAVDGLLGEWDDDLVAGFAPNVELDEPIARRRAEAARLAATHGRLRRAGGVTLATPLRGSWWLSGDRGRVRAFVALTFEDPPRIQELSFTSVPEPPEDLAAAVAAIVAVVGGADDALLPACTDAVVRAELGAVVRELAVLVAPCTVAGPSHGNGIDTATFEIHGRAVTLELALQQDPAGGGISSVRIDPVDRPATTA
jgi:CubicO group peptidase (beta-lactamase class C family)